MKKFILIILALVMLVGCKKEEKTINPEVEEVIVEIEPTNEEKFFDDLAKGVKASQSQIENLTNSSINLDTLKSSVSQIADLELGYTQKYNSVDFEEINFKIEVTSYLESLNTLKNISNERNLLFNSSTYINAYNQRINSIDKFLEYEEFSNKFTREELDNLRSLKPIEMSDFF